MISISALVETAIETILVFGGFFVIGSFLRVQVMGGHVGKLLIFFAVVALAGSLVGAYFTSNALAKRNQSATAQRR